MADPVITNVDNGGVVIGNDKYRDDTFTAAGAGTIVAGTILARLTASLKLVVFVKGGSAGAQIPVAVLTNDLVAAGAGDLPVRALVSGDVRKEKLVIAVDGDDSNIDAAVLDQLRDYGIVPYNVTQLARLDNQ